MCVCARLCVGMCVCVCVRVCACTHACVVYFGMSVQCSQTGKGAGWLLVSRATPVVKMAVYLTGYNDCLVSVIHFCHLTDVTPVKCPA